MVGSISLNVPMHVDASNTLSPEIVYGQKAPHILGE